jgi:hypothetical protein
MKTQQTNEKSDEHVLLGKDFIHIKNWKEWKDCWEEEHRVEFLHSLLHFGFNIPVENLDELGDRLCLYLEIADKNDGRSSNFRRHAEEFEDIPRFRNRLYFEDCTTFTEKPIREKAGFRQILARKAFETLCQKFFKDTSKDYQLPSWFRGLLAPGVLEKLLWFFRLSDEGNIINIKRGFSDHHMETAIKFAEDVCFFMWDCERKYSHHREIDKEDIKIFHSVRSDVIKVLYALDSLYFLTQGGRYKEVDKNHLALLEKLALSYKLHLPSVSGKSLYGRELRKPRDIEEACYGGSQAAEVLLLLNVQKNEQERFNKMREFTNQRRRVENELEKLERRQ